MHLLDSSMKQLSIDMKSLKFLFFIIWFFITNLTFGQLKESDYFSLNCDSIALAVYDTIYIENLPVVYKVLFREKTVYYMANSKRFSIKGEVIIPNLDINMESTILEKIFNIIGTKYQTDELIGFRTFQAQRIFYQAMKHLPGEEDYLKENFFRCFQN